MFKKWQDRIWDKTERGYEEYPLVLVHADCSSEIVITTTLEFEEFGVGVYCRCPLNCSSGTILGVETLEEARWVAEKMVEDGLVLKVNDETLEP